MFDPTQATWPATGGVRTVTIIVEKSVEVIFVHRLVLWSLEKRGKVNVKKISHFGDCLVIYVLPPT